jgi:hypothetical protein
VPVQPAVAPASKGLIPQPVSMSGLSVGVDLRQRQVASNRGPATAAQARGCLQPAADLVCQNANKDKLISSP